MIRILALLAVALCAWTQIDSAAAEAGSQVGARVVLDAEQFDGQSDAGAWRKVRVGHGWAMKCLPGPWSRHLRYDLQFSEAGTFRLWVLARKNPASGAGEGNTISVFLKPAQESGGALSESGRTLAIALQEQRLFRWIDWREGGGNTDLSVPRPGRYSLYLVGGAANDAGWEVDKICLTKDNAQPPTHFDSAP